MGRIMSLPVTYQGKEYFMLVHFANNNDETLLRVSVMNRQLELLICGQDIFRLSHGKICTDFDDPKCAELKYCIQHALEKSFPDRN